MSKEREYRYAVYIGRFQPPHRAHLEAMRQALEAADKLIVVLGSADAAPSIRNPWNVEQREAMIRMGLGELESRVQCVPARDYFYNEQAWNMEIISKVREIVGDEHSVCMMTHFKDASSEYQKDFPWPAVHIQNQGYTIHATDVRRALLSAKTLEIPTGWTDKGGAPWSTNLSKEVAEYIEMWWENPVRADLQAEYEKIEKDKAKWVGTPYPVTFVTTDALVLRGDQMLVVKRKFVPGKGLYALPGGFLKNGERIKDGTIRELKEETRIQIPVPVLKRYMKQTRVFDHPDRDPRGHVITHCTLIDLGPGPRVEVRGDDDAEHATWLPFRDVLEHPHKFYADHAQIIYQFLIERKLEEKDRLLAYVRNEL